jgi:hypothetical protein
MPSVCRCFARPLEMDKLEVWCRSDGEVRDRRLGEKRARRAIVRDLAVPVAFRIVLSATVFVLAAAAEGIDTAAVVTAVPAVAQ